MLNGKATIMFLTVGLIKKIQLYKISYFAEPRTHDKNKIEFEIDTSNYTTKSDLKSATGDDTLDFAKKTDLANLKFDVDKLDMNKLKNIPTGLSNLESKVDKIDVDELVPVPADLSKVSDVVKKVFLKRLNMMNWLKHSMMLVKKFSDY